MTDTKEDYISTYKDTDRHGLVSGIVATTLFIAACACPFLHDIRYWMASLALSLTGGITGLYGTLQSKFNSKSNVPGKLCKVATGLNFLCFAAIVIMLLITIIELVVTGGR